MILATPSVAPVFEVGQHYACTSAHPGRKLHIIVGRVEVVGGVRIVSVTAADADPATRLPSIGHMPFGEPALAASCPKLLDARVAIPAAFSEGYDEWKRATGGGAYFTITLDQAVDAAVGLLGADGR